MKCAAIMNASIVKVENESNKILAVLHTNVLTIITDNSFGKCLQIMTLTWKYAWKIILKTLPLLQNVY